MFFFVPLIARNCVRARRRSVLTILSIAASFCIMGVLMAMYRLFFCSDPTPDEALRLVVRNRISFANPIPVFYAQKIKRVPGVREVMIQQWFGGTYKDARQPANNFARFAVEPEKLFTLHPDYAISRPEEESFLRIRDSCIMGRPLGARLELKLGDRLTLRGDIFPARLNLVVAGFYESALDNDVLYFHNQYLRESLRKFPDFAIMLTVMVDSIESVEPVAERIDEIFHNSISQTKTETEKAFRLSFLEYVGNIKLFLFVVCASLAGTVLLASTNTMAMAVRDRTQEAGVMKALGFAPATIIWLLAGEATLLAGAGGVLGLAGAQLLIAGMHQLPAMMVNLTKLSLSPEVMALQVTLATVCGLLAALPLAWRASRRPIIDCLRQAD